MGFFENTRKPQGFGGKIMVKMMNSGHSKLAKWGFTKIYAKSNAKVLDIGCGGGANIANWLAKCTNGHVTGIDYSNVSVEASKKLNAIAIKQGKCDIVYGDVSSMPFDEESFDCVSAFETVYFWTDLEKCFAEVNRVMKSGGTFLICNESDGTNSADEKWAKKIGGMKIYNEEQLHTALEKAGFCNIKSYVNAKKHWLCIVANK
ncbi:MAG: class I SAM-dependent methyltransferase [Eubacteriales bacterium]|nr:class I SAM-dependent methyltransferase [Eubacteriales bacterium]